MHEELLEIQIIMAEISRKKKSEQKEMESRKDKKLKRSTQKIFNLLYDPERENGKVSEGNYEVLILNILQIILVCSGSCNKNTMNSQHLSSQC